MPALEADLSLLEEHRSVAQRSGDVEALLHQQDGHARRQDGLVRRLGRSHEPVVRQAVAAAVIRERVLDLLRARVGVPGLVPAGGPLAKLSYSEHARLTADAATTMLGVGATLVDHDEGAPWVERLLFAPGLRIGGGTDEIQRNTIGEQGLGLPREPKPEALAVTSWDAWLAGRRRRSPRRSGRTVRRSAAARRPAT